MANDFPFSNTVPATANAPATDQPNMLINNQSNALIWDVDHVGYGTADGTGGSHLQATFFANQAAPTLGTALSIVYPGSRPSVYANATGGSDTNTYTLNALGTLPGSIIKAGGTFSTTTTSGAISFESQFNCISISSDGAGAYTITLQAVTTGDNIIMISSISSGFDPNWSYSNPTLTINSVTTTGPKISFIVLQV